MAYSIHSNQEQSVRKLIFVFGAAFMLLASPVFAQEESTEVKQEEAKQAAEKQEPEQTEQAKMLADAIEQADNLQKELRKQSMALRSNPGELDPEEVGEAMDKLQEKMMDDMKGIATSMLEVAGQADADSDSSLEAIGWILESPLSEFHSKAGELVIEHHVDNPMLPSILKKLTMPTQAGEDLYQGVIANSKERDIQGQASMGLLNYWSQAVELAPMFAGNKQIAERFPEVGEYLASDTVAEMTEEMLLEKMKAMVEEYGDVAVDDSTIGDMVAKKIKAIEIRSRVAVGKVAPDIEGPDIDGEVFKLSDYRGKVVMLDFWGDW